MLCVMGVTIDELRDERKELEQGAVRRVLAGEQFDAPVPRALEKVPVPMRPEVGEAALATIRAILR